MLPRFYAIAKWIKLYMTIELMVLFVGFIVSALQTLYLNPAWTSADLPVGNVLYYAGLDASAKADWVIGFNNVSYFIFSTMKTGWLLFVVVVMISIIGCKRRYIYGICIVIMMLMIFIHAFGLVYMGNALLNCTSYAFCVSPANPTQVWDQYTFVVYGSLALLAIEVLLTILTYLSSREIINVVKNEKEFGAIEHEEIYLVLPSFYAPTDGVLYQLAFLIIMCFWGVIVFFVKNWHIDKFIWTTPWLSYLDVPQYKDLDAQLVSNTYVGIFDLVYFVVYSARWTPAIYVMLGLLLVSGCKRRSTYPFTLFALALVIAYDILVVTLLGTIAFFDYANVAIARDASGNRWYYFTVSYGMSIVSFITGIILWLMMFSVRDVIATIAPNERANGAVPMDGEIHYMEDSPLAYDHWMEKHKSERPDLFDEDLEGMEYE